MTTPACCFCGGTALICVGRGLRHPLKTDHGPFDFYRCEDCGSGTTPEPPSREQLSALYGSFREGLPELHRSITRDDPQIAWYTRCINRVARRTRRSDDSEFRWIDVGAGGGELSALLASRFPRSRGTAMDLHPRPSRLDGLDRVEWRHADVNEDFAEGLPAADLVISTAVWEHVLRPERFVAQLIRLLSPSATLYLLCPNYDSMARRLLGARWPYFTPGEHLNMPTPEGARLCLEREWERQGPADGATIESNSLMLPYTLRYVFRRLGLDWIGRRIPSALRFPMPVGALETVLERRPGGSAV
jgi:SAM-dependent methyltransferase